MAHGREFGWFIEVTTWYMVLKTSTFWCARTISLVHDWKRLRRYFIRYPCIKRATLFALICFRFLIILGAASDFCYHIATGNLNFHPYDNFHVASLILKTERSFLFSQLFVFVTRRGRYFLWNAKMHLTCLNWKNVNLLQKKVYSVALKS